MRGEVGVQEPGGQGRQVAVGEACFAVQHERLALELADVGDQAAGVKAGAEAGCRAVEDARDGFAGGVAVAAGKDADGCSDGVDAGLGTIGKVDADAVVRQAVIAAVAEGAEELPEAGERLPARQGQLSVTPPGVEVFDRDGGTGSRRAWRCRRCREKRQESPTGSGCPWAGAG